MKLILTFWFVISILNTYAQIEKVEADADYLLDKAEYASALELYHQLIRQNRLSSLNYYLRGLCQFNLGNNKEAIVDFTKSLEIVLRETDLRELWPMGDRLQKVGKDKYMSFENLRSMKYFYYEIYFYRGLAKYNLSDYRGAILDYSEVLKLQPDNHYSLYNRGLTYYDLKDYDRAISDLSKVIELDAKSALAYYVRGVCYNMTGKINEGCLDLSKSGELGFEEAYEAIKHFCVED